MLMMRNDLLLLSDEEVLNSLEAYKKSIKKKIKVKGDKAYFEKNCMKEIGNLSQVLYRVR
jgi:hypothetical protein